MAAPTPKQATVSDHPPATRRLLANIGRILRSREQEASSIVLSGLPWLGVPVLFSAVLARVGRGLPGEVLPVVAFLPLALAAYVVAFLAPPKWRALGVAVPGWLAVIGLVFYLWSEPHPGIARTIWLGLAFAVLSTVITAIVGRNAKQAAALSTGFALAMVFSQSLDGWLTYLAVGNPFGWLETPVTERVLFSRLILEAAPLVFPFMKVGLGVVVSLALGRPSARPEVVIPLSVLVCYVGFSPAMFSVANLLAR